METSGGEILHPSLPWQARVGREIERYSVREKGKRK
jgi:hypothetical protein